jgi:hypothetical protein
MFEAILIPAFVAAFVTLSIEYAAKPRLDARRERILELHEAARKADRAFGLLCALVGRYMAWFEEGGGPIDRLDELVIQAETACAELESALLIGDNLPLPRVYLKALDTVATRALAWTTVRRHGVSHGELLRYVAEQIDPLIDLADEARRLSWWQQRRRQDVHARIEATAAPEDAAH